MARVDGLFQLQDDTGRRMYIQVDVEQYKYNNYVQYIYIYMVAPPPGDLPFSILYVIYSI